MRPKYCPCENEMPDPCPACGATVAGNDKVKGACQAIFNRPAPRPLVELILVDKYTGERI